MTQVGACKKHGLVEPEYGWFWATYHCPVCGDFIEPAPEQPKPTQTGFDMGDAA